jgi:hypothetical protein
MIPDDTLMSALGLPTSMRAKVHDRFCEVTGIRLATGKPCFERPKVAQGLACLPLSSLYPGIEQESPDGILLDQTIDEVRKSDVVWS